MVNSNEIINSIFDLIGSIAEYIRGTLASISPDNSMIILLALSAVGGFYLAKRYPKLEGVLTIVVYTVIIFLLLGFT